MSSLSDLSVPVLNEISVDAWSRNADYWDAAMGQDGNDFFQVLELPALKRLVQPRSGESAIDIGTGNGLVARWLYSEGVDLLATDASDAVLETAKRQLTLLPKTDRPGLLGFRKLDVTKKTELDKLKSFDIITMNMVIMDIPTLEPFAAALPGLLKKDGRFVATVLHPAFCSSGTTLHIEIGENSNTGRQEIIHSINVKRYLNVPPARGQAISDQPVAQIYFSRSMSELFAPFFKAGLILDGLEELAFPETPDETLSIPVESFKNFPQIPLILAFRFRKVA
ncbi:hypothetical protein MMC30_005754 [Trapelia coarctata]|nr:hypothetical protein [Trapelia coarctata]